MLRLRSLRQRRFILGFLCLSRLSGTRQRAKKRQKQRWKNQAQGSHLIGAPFSGGVFVAVAICQRSLQTMDLAFR
jgi:hypothetical protein